MRRLPPRGGQNLNYNVSGLASNCSDIADSFLYAFSLLLVIVTPASDSAKNMRLMLNIIYPLKRILKMPRGKKDNGLPYYSIFFLFHYPLEFTRGCTTWSITLFAYDTLI